MKRLRSEAKPALTIVRYEYSYDDFPHRSLDSAAVELLVGAYSHIPKAMRQHTVPLKLLECVAQLTGLSVSAAPLAVPEFWRLCLAYVGAINSQTFISASAQWRHRHSTAFKTAIDWLRKQGHFVPPLEYTSEINRLSPSLEPFVDLFEHLSLEEEAVWLWRGWWARNSEGQEQSFALYPVYARLGRSFTVQMHDALATYVSRGKYRHLPLVRPLGAFIGSYPGQLDAQHFRDPTFMTKFWAEFFKNYVDTAHKKGNKLETILAAWNNQGQSFIHDCLEASRLFAKPHGGMPAAPSRSKRGAATNITKTSAGIEVKTRLVTHVPLELSDELAIQILFVDIEREVKILEAWAMSEFEATHLAATNRPTLAAQGKVRTVQKVGTNTSGHKSLVAPGNPQALMNAAATFEHLGYQTHEDADLSLLYPKPLPETALRLGIPSAGALLPHLTLLVLDHPKITASFLQKLKLFDKHDRQAGLVFTDQVHYLIGRKDRAGVAQEIPLTERGIRVVNSLIEITRPLRDYLRERGDPDWRYLLLSSGKSFGYPQRVNNISGWTTDPLRQLSIASSIKQISGLEQADAEDLARRFSLAALRASVGVLVYLRTGSVQAMADALGHKEYDPRLLEHYLPTPILRFFQERWIRIFQGGLIIHAMRESSHLLRASGFDSMSQLHAFLEKHAFRPLSDTARRKKSEAKSIEVVFGVNEVILSVLHKLHCAVRSATSPVSGLALYWAAIAERLFQYIDSASSGREDLRQMLHSARNAVTAHSFHNLVYGNQVRG